MSTDKPTMRVRSTEDLLASIPYLLGFQPDASLLYLVLADGHVINTARLDLPAPATLPTTLADALNRVAAWLARRNGAHAVVVGYGPADRVEHTVRAAVEALRTTNVPVDLAVRVTAGRFWHLDHDHPMSAPPDGTPFDPSTSPVTATAVYHGLVALPDRDAFAATIAPVTGPDRDRMAAATTVACQRYIDVLDSAAAPHATTPAEADTSTWRDLHAEALTRLRCAEDHYRRATPFGDDDAAALTLLLELPIIRDVACRRTGREAWQVAMWTDLVRRAAPEFRTTPAVLLPCAPTRPETVLWPTSRSTGP